MPVARSLGVHYHLGSDASSALTTEREIIDKKFNDEYDAILSILSLIKLRGKGGGSRVNISDFLVNDIPMLKP